MPTALDPAGLGAFLKERRARLDPSAFGFGSVRRRTPGLRREEVAQRAEVSAVWYTWLEQGRGGAPSTDVLGRLSEALALTGAEREHLFLLAQGRPPEVRWREPQDAPPRLQRLLDAFETTPALAKTALGDVVAWNRAAALVIHDFGRRAPDDRNMLRLMFLDGGFRGAQPDWETDARAGLAAFRLHLSRSGASAAAATLVEELRARSPDFARFWRENDVGGLMGGEKVLDHPRAGRLRLEISALAVDGRPDLSLMVYAPASPADAERMRGLLAAEG